MDQVAAGIRGRSTIDALLKPEFAARSVARIWHWELMDLTELAVQEVPGFYQQETSSASDLQVSSRVADGPSFRG